MKKAFALVVLMFTPTMAFAQGTYVWSSTDGDPGGISGTIVLSLPSYSGDFNASHIVSLTLADSLSGTYNVELATDIYASGSIMAWGPTGISEMVLGLSKGAPASSWFLIADQNNDYGFNPPASIREFGIAGDFWGAWVSVPEPSTFALASLGLAALLVLRRRR